MLGIVENRDQESVPCPLGVGIVGTLVRSRPWSMVGTSIMHCCPPAGPSLQLWGISTWTKVLGWGLSGDCSLE